MLPENGQIDVAEVELEDSDLESELQKESETDNGPFQSSATGDCEPIETRGFISPEISQDLEIDAIKKALDQQPPNLNDDELSPTYEIPILDWPDIGMPMNEFSTEGLATKCLPALFPDGKGDPFKHSRLLRITLVEAFDRLLAFCKKGPDGTPVWRFASHPIFPGWAADIKRRHAIMGQANVFVRQNPGELPVYSNQMDE